MKAILNPVPALKAIIVAERADEIELTTGVTIMVKASDFGGDTIGRYMYLFKRLTAVF